MTATENEKNWEIDDQAEKEFAELVLEENKEILEKLTDQAQSYVLEGRSDKFYILVKSVNLILKMSQARMKQTLGIDAASLN